MSGSGATVRVRARVRDCVMEGEVHLPSKAGGIHARVSDLLNQDAQFVALTNVFASPAIKAPDAPRVHYDVILLRKDHIEYVLPLE